MVNEDFRDTEDLDGLFSGFDPDRQYDPSTWAVRGAKTTPPGQPPAAATRSQRLGPRGRGRARQRRPARGRRPGAARRDPAGPALRLPDPQAPLRPLHPGDGPRCLRRQPGQLRLGLPRSPRTPAASARPASRTRRLDAAHVGAQYIRGAAILQLLLGNMGRPGGGIMALRGHASIQGSTDIPTLFNLLPGYLPMPAGGTTPRRLPRGGRVEAAEGLLGRTPTPTP
jgi:formate dehydrogenase major subunit